MLTEVKMLIITCDNCGAEAPCCNSGPNQDHKHNWYMRTRVSDQLVGEVLRDLVTSDNWTEDGEGKAHCPACERLTLTDEAKAERARERERNGLALFELEGTPS